MSAYFLGIIHSLHARRFSFPVYKIYNYKRSQLITIPPWYHNVNYAVSRSISKIAISAHNYNVQLSPTGNLELIGYCKGGANIAHIIKLVSSSLGYIVLTKVQFLQFTVHKILGQ